ncbi:MAG: hypothetical protein U0R44_04565 [Candidatus Micrarchaeia archaeon]
MEILGVPARNLLLCLVISAAISVLLFLPALKDFGSSFVGKEDIRLFIWLFWHYQGALQSGTDPLFASEIFYPAGVSLARTTIVPLLGAAYIALPSGLGTAGRITILQMLSFVLGGVFSFALCYRSAKSFLPAMTGSVVFNLSAFHIQSAVNHLNYMMAVPFIALFFVFYLEMAGRKRQPGTAIWLSVSLLLIALNEATAAVMLGLVVLLDVCRRYMSLSGITLDGRKAAALAVAGFASLALSTAIDISVRSPLAGAFIPPIPFIAVLLGYVIGWENLLKMEKKHRFFTTLAAASLPALAYLALLAFSPSYDFLPDPAIVSGKVSAVPLEYLIIPSDITIFGRTVGGLPSAAESGVYIGLPMMIILAYGWLSGKDSGWEKGLMEMFLVSLLLAFPFMTVSDQVIGASPFFPQTIFPLLSVLRVPARFIVFAALFASVICSAVLKRALEGRKGALIFMLAAAALLSLERWPAYGDFLFRQDIPGFYNGLAASGEKANIFIYPDLDYYALLDEAYYQTIHGGNLSYGVISRPPSPDDEFNRIYWGMESRASIIDFIRRNRYGYVVVEKTRCVDAHDCFTDRMHPEDEGRTGPVLRGLANAFGDPVFEDGSIAVYRAG